MSDLCGLRSTLCMSQNFHVSTQLFIAQQTFLSPWRHLFKLGIRKRGMHSYETIIYFECCCLLGQNATSRRLSAAFLLCWFSTLKMELICSSERLVQKRNTLCYIPDGGNIHNYSCENLKPYNTNFWFSMIIYISTVINIENIGEV
jgi:hypothetical protein